MRTAPEFGTDIMRISTHIETLAAHDCEINVRQGNAINGVAVNMHQPWLALDRFSLAREFVKRNPSVFDGGNHRRHLVKIAAKFFEGSANRVIGQYQNFARLDYVALSVVRRRGNSERHRARVFLVFSHEKVLNFGPAAKGQKKQTRRDWIKGTAMADLFDLQTAAHQRDDIVRSHASGFVHEQDPVSCCV